jgi:putative SOS response-associated peptidase YedK
MCNRYRPASVVRIPDAFGVTYIESGPDLRYNTAGIGPLQPGPFLRPRQGLELLVGQWGLTPDDSITLRPASKKTGRPISTNNARWGNGEPEAWTFKGAWRRGQRCLIPAEDYDEPYWGTGKNIWWRFARADCQPWAFAGLWNEWTDPSTAEVIPSYTMLTINCDAHPLLRLMHKPERDKEGNLLPPEKQDKRTVVPLEREHWDEWLHGSRDQAAALVRLPGSECFQHGAADPSQAVALPT